MTRRFAPEPPAIIARSIPREPGSREARMGDLSRTVVVRLAIESYRVEAPLFLAIRRDLEGTR